MSLISKLKTVLKGQTKMDSETSIDRVAELERTIAELQQRIDPKPIELSEEAQQEKQAAHVAAVMAAMSPSHTYRKVDPHAGERQVHIVNPKPVMESRIVSVRPFDDYTWRETGSQPSCEVRTVTAKSWGG